MSKKNQSEEKATWGRVKNKLKMGIVGLPNVGKSSCFNLLSNLSIPALNYPFCTIEPNVAQVVVNDPRLTKLVEMWKPKSQIPAYLEVIDIAGLVQGAHLGQGLGNDFLSNIQSVDGIYHMVRAFKDEDVVHVEGEVDPVRDIKIINNELLQKDLAFVIKQLDEAKKAVERFNDDQAKKQLELLIRLKECLDQGKWIRHAEWTNQEINQINKLFMFTAKAIVYLVNISKADFESKKNKWLTKIKQYVDENCPGKMIPFSVEYEQEIFNTDKKDASMIRKIIDSGNDALNLMHFFTCGKDEVKSWTIRSGCKAPQAGGVIHSDMEEGFISAEVMAYDDLVTLGSDAEVKKQGKYKMCGKEYIMKDADIVFFKFNKPTQKKK